MHENINEDNVSDKILSGELNIEYYDEKSVHECLSLLKKRTATQIDDTQKLTEEEFKTVVKQSKRRSTSSMFSKKYCSVCKCAMNCERMVKVLVRFYNIITKHNQFPSRWLDALDVMIEKGKSNKINKLRVMQIIEADLQLII